MRLIDADALIEKEERYELDRYIDGERCYEMAVPSWAIIEAPTIETKQADDLISRADAIEAVASADETNGTEKVFSGLEIVDIIKAIPSAQPKQEWIPCSERLPKDIRPVLVTWKNNDPASYYQYIVGKHFIGTAHYHRGKWYWYSSVTEDLLAEYGKCDSEEFDEAIEAVAWMPLPQPYNGARMTDSENPNNCEQTDCAWR